MFVGILAPLKPRTDRRMILRRILGHTVAAMSSFPVVGSDITNVDASSCTE
jgi:hypothetical protein